MSNSKIQSEVNADSWVVVGKFGRVHGVQGQITLYSFTEPFDNILTYPALYVSASVLKNSPLVLKNKGEVIEPKFNLEKTSSLALNNENLTLFLEDARPVHGHILVKVRGYETREEVAFLTNVELKVPRKELPILKPGEYYWHDLVGLRVKNTEGKVLGTVSEVFATGSNDVLIIEKDLETNTDAAAAKQELPEQSLVGNKKLSANKKKKQQILIPYLPKDVILSVDLAERLITVNWDEDY